MPGGIFLLDPAGELTEMAETASLFPVKRAEIDLQQLLARHPDLLAEDQIDPGTPRRWLLVSREVGIPDQEQGGSRWALDHLFLDQDGVPTLVEVKRGSDPRTRREVVGQMLDYAANSVLYWTPDALQAWLTPGISFPPDAIERRPSLRLRWMAEEGRVERFLEVLEWVVGEVRRGVDLAGLARGDYWGGTLGRASVQTM